MVTRKNKVILAIEQRYERKREKKERERKKVEEERKKEINNSSEAAKYDNKSKNLKENVVFHEVFFAKLYL